MSKTLKEFQQEISALPKSEQLELLDWLLNADAESDPEANEAWIKLAEERSAEIRSGRVEPISGSDVLRKIQERYGVEY